jgi:hypothetical protein
MCVRRRHSITVYRLGEDNQQDIDHATHRIVEGSKVERI